MTEAAGAPIEIRNADLPAIERALGQLIRVPVRATSAVTIARHARAVAAAAAALRARRDRLVAEYAARDDDGHYVPAPGPGGAGMISIDAARADAFEAAVRELLDETVTLPDPPLGPADLRRQDGTPADLPPVVLLELGPLFSDDAAG